MDDAKIVGIVIPIVGAVAAAIGGILKIWLDSRKKQQLAVQEIDLEMGNTVGNLPTTDRLSSFDSSIPEEPSDDTKEIMTKEEIIETEMEGNFSSEETLGFFGIVPHRKSLIASNNFGMIDEKSVSIAKSTANSNDLALRDVKSDGDISESINRLSNSVYYDSQSGYDSENSRHLKVKVTKMHREQTVKSHKGSTTLSGSTELKSISPPPSPSTLAKSYPATKSKPKPIKQSSIESINDSASVSSNSKIPSIKIAGENFEEE